ncbi:MAG: ligase-associated DNA damage response endonuclease PdeM [Sphingobium sp.]
MVPFLFHNEMLHPLMSGALWWPAERALLVADLHFEKARFYAATGQYLPPYDSIETARLLATQVAEQGARRVICLGDSFHDAAGALTLPDEARAILAGIEARIDEWIWITGNHDESAAFSFGRSVADLTLRGLALRHEAVADCPLPELSGHFHPKIRLRARGQSIARRCFLMNGTKLILPAFGALTGGLDVRHPAIHAALRPPITALVPGRDRLLRFPVEVVKAA